MVISTARRRYGGAEYRLVRCKAVYQTAISMTLDDPDLFHEPAFRFSLRKPHSWRFMPPAWSPVAHLKNASDPQVWIHMAQLPFCCAMQFHDSPRHAYPTVQVTARPCLAPSPSEAAVLLEQLVALTTAQHPDLVVHHATTHGLIAGYNANIVRASFSIPYEVDGEYIPLTVLSRAYVVFGREKAFSIGMPSSADPAYFNESEFEAMIRSVRID
ncbi:MAG: hypothetical protein IT353_19495 [Gemmatimonadaceae bacterium]|nr:hypothetical protein [Gemmatimonadaceae bacterium]